MLKAGSLACADQEVGPSGRSEVTGDTPLGRILGAWPFPVCLAAMSWAVHSM